MHLHNPWKLEPRHLRVCFRRVNINVEEDCIDIPHEITGPDMDNHGKEFYVWVTVGKITSLSLGTKGSLSLAVACYPAGVLHAHIGAIFIVAQNQTSVIAQQMCSNA